MLRNYNEFTILSDKIKNIKLNNLPNNIRLNTDDKYKLNVKYDTLQLKYVLNIPSAKVYLPVLNSPYTLYTVDWGDIPHSDASTIFETNYNIPSCEYQNTEKTFVTIKIRGDFKGFDNSNSMQGKDYNYFYYSENPNQTVEVAGKQTYNVDSYLYSIDNWGSVPFETLSKAFLNASGLIFIPNDSMPNVNDCSSAYMNCINLCKGFNYQTSSMQNFMLPLNITNATDMFKNTFIKYNFKNLVYPQYLTSISGIFSHTEIIDLNSAFFEKQELYSKEYPDISQNLYSSYQYALPSTMYDFIHSTNLVIKDRLVEKK